MPPSRCNQVSTLSAHRTGYGNRFLLQYYFLKCFNAISWKEWRQKAHFVFETCQQEQHGVAQLVVITG